jgi:hypothetical protein
LNQERNCLIFPPHPHRNFNSFFAFFAAVHLLHLHQFGLQSNLVLKTQSINNSSISKLTSSQSLIKPPSFYYQWPKGTKIIWEMEKIN